MNSRRKITSEVVYAFENRSKKSKGNTYTDGIGYYLHGNKIAEHRSDGLYISNAGWFSDTTKERLSGLQGVSINQKDLRWYLNGIEWDGNWIKINN